MEKSSKMMAVVAVLVLVVAPGAEARNIKTAAAESKDTVVQPTTFPPFDRFGSAVPAFGGMPGGGSSTPGFSLPGSSGSTPGFGGIGSMPIFGGLGGLGGSPGLGGLGGSPGLGGLGGSPGLGGLGGSPGLGGLGGSPGLGGGMPGSPAAASTTAAVDKQTKKP